MSNQKKSEPRHLGGYEQKLYRFLYQGDGNSCKSLIEHRKLYHFFTFFIFFGGKGNQVGSRQSPVGSVNQRSKVRSQRSEKIET